jgi:transposase-like protein
MEAAKRSEARNPFGAGRPERFDEEDKKGMLEMKNSGMTYRQIAEEYGCSTSIVYKAVCHLKYGWK